ncbi:malonate decarboxylase holo-ACP synthase [Acinetobacter larvae]|uniref:Phosphoribosyl-dephospho-CoA transferase n=1 Tax=Acinetobacter larvae TaxID=1789224 RepID=A0A1B2LYH1_9GAMM|nr:malonate decarboxylase holo-ACP synthase [Acinetobacter larvae]AOA57823.1 phosphoribosyl-dephospho-CoA transferase [Acinetobacter larvae]
MRQLFKPHDLLWGFTVDMLSADAPEWVGSVVAQALPVVVRRDLCATERIAVGIRGAQRWQRYATDMPMKAVSCCIQPEQLTTVDLMQFPHLNQALSRVQSVMQDHAIRQWGYTGSVGYELATHLACVHQASDIDLIIRCDQALSQSFAQQLLQDFTDAQLNVDIQLQTPLGAIALKEWASKRAKVLLKRQDSAVLVSNPWAAS